MTTALRQMWMGAVHFEVVLNQTQMLLADQSKEKREQLRWQALEVAGRTPYSAVEVLQCLQARIIKGVMEEGAEG